MAEKKMTRKEALEFVLALPEVENNAEVAEVIGKIYASVTRPRVKSDAPSKARILNESLAAQCVAAIREHGEPVTGKWLIEHVNGLMTPQKVTAVMKIAIENGEATREKNGKVITYSASSSKGRTKVLPLLFTPKLTVANLCRICGTLAQ